MKMKLTIISICICFLLLGACSQQPKYTIDKPDDLLTQTYDIDELNKYIKNKNATNLRAADFEDFLYYEELNSKFPVELIRYGGNLPYTVYKVNQGGYYYVFWSWAYPKELEGEIDKSSKEYMCVYFSAYINEGKSKSAFNSLEIGISTAEDVKNIDPYVEFVSLSGRGFLSYSWLNPKEIIEITYSYKESEDPNKPYDPYKSQVVKEVNIIPIEKAASCYRLIVKQEG